MGKRGVPDRWEQYSNMGRRISGTRFICFKVPLDPKYPVDGISFTPRDLTDHCQQLGLVIDLTNTTRYYQPECFTNLSIQYKKIFTEGHVVPSKPVVGKFIDAVNKFVDETPDENKLVGVHCTHGINRTGYLVCRYMIQVLDIAPDQAIADFESARGHVQERQNYLQDLRQALWMNEDPANYRVVNRTFGKNYVPNRGGNKNQGGDAGGGVGDYSAYGGEELTNGAQGAEAEEGEGDSSQFQTPEAPSGSSLFNTSGSGGRSIRRAKRWSDSGRPSRKELSPRDAVGYPSTDDDGGDTPKGVKRYRERSESVSSRGPWLPPVPGEEEERPRLKFKKSHQDSRYAHVSHQRYDPYFYQQRDGGGPTRSERQYGAPVPSPVGRKDGAVKKYRGARRYKSPVKEDHSPAVGFEDHQPLAFPEENRPQKGFLDSPSDLRGPKRNPQSPGAELDVFSPEPTPGRSNPKRRSRRFEPY